MAAPSYTTDLTTFNDCSSNTDWVEMTGMAVGGGADLDSDLGIYGSVCISELIRKTGLASLAYNNGSAVTVPTDGGFFIWSKYQAPNGVEVIANGGIGVVIGSSTTVWGNYNLDGSDTYPYGGWVNYFVDPTLTPNVDNGGYTTAYQYCGTSINVTNVVSKGNPQSIDIIRYGRGSSIFTDGDLGNGYATFNGYALVNDNPTTGRFGLFQDIGGSYLWKGLMSLGTIGTSVDFRDSNVNIVIQNTFKASSTFNRIEINNISSNVEWEGINITSLSTVSRGDLEVIDDATISIINSSFVDMGTFTLDSNSTLESVTFRRTDQVVQNASSLDKCIIEGNINILSSLISDDPATISNCIFTYNSNHAIEITTIGTYTFTGNLFSDYLGTPGSNLIENSGDVGSAIYNNSGGLVTLNITGGGQVPSIRNSIGSTTITTNTVILNIINIVPNSEVRIFDFTTNDELAGAETSGSTFTYSYNYTGDVTINLVVHKEDYVYFFLEGFVISGSDQTIQVQQRFDRNYLNP